MNLSSKKLIFVTGKGGVGKSVLAAAVAFKQAKEGRKVCLVELGETSFYESLFETRGISYEPSEIIPQVHISLINAEDSLKEYVNHYIKVPKIYEIFFQNKIMSAFINAAPALPELAILGKLTSDIRGVILSDYEVIVVDAYSTGHTLALLRAPIGLSQTFQVGPLNDQALNIHKVLCDSTQVHYIIATLPEEMPVNETLELDAALKKEFNAETTIVCNQLVHSGVSSQDQQILKKNMTQPQALEFLEYVSQKEQIQKLNLEKLKHHFGSFYGARKSLVHCKGQELIENIVKDLEKPWDLTNS